MKKILLAFLLLFIGITTINAKSIQNYYNLEIEENYYNELCEIYGENYVYFLTKDEFNLIKNNDLSKVEKVIFSDNLPNLSRTLVTHTTNYKTLYLINNNGVITVQLKWKKDPVIRSHDVMGVRFQGVTLNSNVYFKQDYLENGVNKTNTSSTLKKFDNGLGVSFLLSDKTDLESYMTFSIKGTGKVYATYQHAASTVSLSDSTNYTISATGLGSVLQFANNIGNNYDRMNGVNISI